MSYEEYAATIKRSRKAIRNIDPKTPHYYPLAKLAVQLDGMMIRYVHNPSRELCSIAIGQLSKRKNDILSTKGRLPTYSHVIRYIKDPDLQLIKLGLRHSPIMINYVIENLVPNNMSQDQLIEEVINNNPVLLEFLDAKYHCQKLIDHVVEFGQGMSWIKSTKQSPVFYWSFLLRDPGAIKYIPHPTRDMISCAVMADPQQLSLLGDESPEAFLIYAQIWQWCSLDDDIETCLINKVTKKPKSMRFIPDKYLTFNVFKAAVDENPTAICTLPLKSPDYFEIAAYAIKINPKNLKHARRQTEALALLAVTINSKSIKYVLRVTRPIWDMAIKTNPLALKYVPRKYQTEAMIQSCVDRNPFAIIYAKKFNIDHCRDALRNKSVVWKVLSNKRLMNKIKQYPAVYQLLDKTERECIVAYMQGVKINHIPYKYRTICMTLPNDLKHKLFFLYYLPYDPKICYICCNPGNLDYQFEPCKHTMCLSCMIQVFEKGCPFCRQTCESVSLIA